MKIKELNFIERLSALLDDKQTIFKQSKNVYFVQRLGEEMNKEEVEEYLLAELGERLKLGEKNDKN